MTTVLCGCQSINCWLGAKFQNNANRSELLAKGEEEILSFSKKNNVKEIRLVWQNSLSEYSGGFELYVGYVWLAVCDVIPVLKFEMSQVDAIGVTSAGTVVRCALPTVNFFTIKVVIQ